MSQIDFIKKRLDGVYFPFFALITFMHPFVFFLPSMYQSMPSYHQCFLFYLLFFPCNIIPSWVYRKETKGEVMECIAVLHSSGKIRDELIKIALLLL